MRGYLYVLVGASSYGLVAVIVKLALDEHLGPEAIATSQSMLGFSVLALAYLVRRAFRARAPLPSRRDTLGLLGLGVSTGVTAVLYYGALSQLSATLAVVLLFQFTWMGVLAEALLARKIPSLASLASVLLAWVGTWLAVGAWEGVTFYGTSRGLAYGVGAGVAYTVFVVGTSRVATDVSPLDRSVLMAASALAVLVVAFPPKFLGDPTRMRALLPWSAMLAGFGVIVPNVAFALGSPRIGGERASIVAAVELPVAVIAAHVVLGERMSSSAVLGVALILVAVMLPALDRVRRGED